MQRVNSLMAVLAAGSLVLGASVALASTEAAKAPVGSKETATQVKSKAEIHRVRGDVTAVEPSANPPTLTMKTMEGKQALTVGVDVTDKSLIREGKARKTLADIKAGDRVWMRYERTDGKLVADYIRILKPAGMAAKSASPQKSY